MLTLLATGCFTSGGDQVVHEFTADSTDEIVDSGAISLDTETSVDGTASIRVQRDESGKGVIGLYQVDDAEINNSRLVYMAKMKTEGVENMAYLRLRVATQNDVELVSYGPPIPLSGDSEWTEVATELFLDRGNKARSIGLDLVIDGKGTVWIDQVGLLKKPLRLNYLFWGHIVFWLILLIYFIIIMNKHKELGKKIEALSGSVK